MRRSVFTTIAFLGLLAPTSGRAEPLGPSLRLELGLGSGFTNGDLIFAFNPVGSLVIDAGAGAGIVGVGAHAAARVALASGRTRVLVGLGVATTFTSFDSSIHDILPLVWITGDLVLQRSFGRWFLGGSLGGTVFVSRRDEGCGCWFEHKNLLLPVITLGVGREL